MDDHQREIFKQLGYMYYKNCPCCNWSLSGNKRKNKRLLHKGARARLKRQLAKEVSNE